MKNRMNHGKTKSRFTEKLKRCLASAACVIGIAAVCIGVAGYQNKVQAEDDQVVTRGVVNSLGQIPQTKKDMYDQGKTAQDYAGVDMTLGSKKNPFLILEIVPSEAYAEFGYHISGCEPVDMEEAALMDNSPVYTISSIGEGKVSQETVYFFPDEIKKELQSKYSNKIHKYGQEYGKAYKGYYECVEKGTGNFIQNKDGSFSKSEDGNFIWHTVNSFEESNYTGITFSQEPDKNKKVSEVGQRVYTVRINSEEDPIDKIDNYVSFVNKDVFLKDTLQKETIEDIQNYSIIIKTITPAELNKNPAWADYADFYVVSTNSHNKELANAWKKCNRLGITADVDTDVSGFENTSSNQEKDISWEVVMHMYNKITADINYAAIAMDATTYGSSLNGESVKYIQTDILDWNMRPTGKKDEAYRKASNNNMYKLTIMLISMRPNLFKQLYLNGYEEGKALISKEGKFTAQTGDAQEYWTMFTFYPSEKSDTSELPGNSWYKSWADVSNWPEYQMPGNIEEDGFGDSNNRNYVNNSNRLFTYNSGNTMTSGYESEDLGTSSANIKYEDFRDFLGDKKKATPSDAVRFILGTNSNPNNQLVEGNLRVLDIEPGYDKKSASTDSENGYFLKESYVYLMLPKFKGTVTITHMTTAEFIGSAEDLNSKYNMIYIGTDSSAYNHDENGDTVWNDSAMNGKIYFHTGDKLEANPNYKMDGRNYAVSYLWSVKNQSVVSGNTIRFPGNDITKIKQNELENFLEAGYPVVADSYLYDMDQTKIDQHSNICNFIRKNKGKDNLLNTKEEKEKFYSAIRQARPSVVFTETPNIYNGETDTTYTVSDPNYLGYDDKGHVLLPFKFRVVNADGTKFKYRIYLDQNQDGKFDEDELYHSGSAFDAGAGEQKYSCKLSANYTGLIQWKIEVYEADNEQVHFSKTGCSAAKIKNPQDKKIVKVLQIMPDSQDNYRGKLNLSTDKQFTKYYNNLHDYEIKMTSITLSEFEANFTSENPFSYDYSKELDDDTCDSIGKSLTKKQRELYDYNMFIIGFGDCYARSNLSNEHGAVDFIKFYIACGKSVLFTHDLTSFFNIDSSDYGYTANTYLRDLMGMNRYGAVSSKLTDTERNQLISYQSKLKYDTVTDLNGDELEQKHGYTYYAMRRLALGTKADSQKMPYSYLLDNELYKEFKNDNASRTQKVTRTNEGQITQYPFKIPQNLKVASTHGQYYQLDMEDPNVTVWYCLADDNSKNDVASIYGVSPNDAANNYYIYSKENVFYSGVGDTKIDGDDEAKLFINTMIAAYRASYEAPMFQILNDEAEVTDRENMNYSMIAGYQEYNDDDEGSSQNADDANDMVKIYFAPEDFNAITPNLMGMIYYENEDNTCDYVKTIYDAETNEAINATEVTTTSGSQTDSGNKETKWAYQNLVNMHEYYFLYPKKYLYEWKDGETTRKARRTVKFYIKNDKSKLPRYQELNLSISALFKLD